VAVPGELLACPRNSPRFTIHELLRIALDHFVNPVIFIRGSPEEEVVRPSGAIPRDEAN
jgi:hypothetical protein